jgi:hypothetical protein
MSNTEAPKETLYARKELYPSSSAPLHPIKLFRTLRNHRRALLLVLRPPSTNVGVSEVVYRALNRSSPLADLCTFFPVVSAACPSAPLSFITLMSCRPFGASIIVLYKYNDLYPLLCFHRLSFGHLGLRPFRSRSQGVLNKALSASSTRTTSCLSHRHDLAACSYSRATSYKITAAPDRCARFTRVGTRESRAPRTITLLARFTLDKKVRRSTESCQRCIRVA